MWVNTYRRYLYGSRPLALAVSTKEYTMALDSAPLTESQKSQFFRPTTKGRMAFSARLFEIGISPCSKKHSTAAVGFENIAQRRPTCSLSPDEPYQANRNIPPEAAKRHSGGILFCIWLLSWRISFPMKTACCSIGSQPLLGWFSP